MLGLTEQLAGCGSSGAGDSRGGGKARRGSRISLQLATENVIVQNRDDAVVGDGIVDVVKMAQNRMKGATAKEVFQRIDKDGGGELDRRETRRALKELGIDPDSKLVQRQIKKFDEDGSGTLDLEEFEAFVSSI